MTREDWITAAFEVLLERGINAVTVEKLCRILGVTKGSFYHHFTDRSDLLDGLVEHWKSLLLVTRQDRSEITERDTLYESLASTIEWALNNRVHRWEAALVSWGVRDPEVQSTRREVNDSRIDASRDPFLRFGFSEEEAEIRARMWVFNFSAMSVFSRDQPDPDEYFEDYMLWLARILATPLEASPAMKSAD
jgi:AcrR family transcriptional regulator